MKDKKAIKQLASAAARGDAKTVSALVKGKSELAGEWKPIMDACFQGQAESVRMLLKYGADPNIKSPTAHNYRPLHRTVEFKKTAPKTEGHMRTVECLLEHGADPMMRGTWYNVSAVAVAAFGGTAEFLPLLLQKAPRSLDIFHAAALGNLARVRALLKKNPQQAAILDDLEGQKRDGWSALRYCALSRMGHTDRKLAHAQVEIARLLTENGADPKGCVDLACWANNPSVAKVLLENGGTISDDDTLNHVACDGHTEVLEVLVEHDVPLDGTRGTEHHGGYTPLGCAVSCRSLRGVQWFLDNGQNPNRIKSKTGETALHVAVNWRASDKMLKLLVDSGTKLKAKDTQGRTALDLARAIGYAKAVVFLEVVAS